MSDAEAGLTLHVDALLCSGHGRCYSLSPQLLQTDDQGFVSARGQDTPVPPGLEEAARIAAEACPEQAIHIN